MFNIYVYSFAYMNKLGDRSIVNRERARTCRAVDVPVSLHALIAAPTHHVAPTLALPSSSVTHISTSRNGRGASRVARTCCQHVSNKNTRIRRVRCRDGYRG